jgi:hypothetical protein
VGGCEPEGFVEANSGGAPLVGGQLHQAAAVLAGLPDRPFDHGAAKSCFGDHEPAARISRNLLERLPVRVVRVSLSPGAQHVISQQRHDERHVLAPRVPEDHQADLDGGVLDYPPDAFSRGLIAGRAVPCLSARQQRRFRIGYEHRPQDTHDLAQLDALSDQ